MKSNHNSSYVISRASLAALEQLPPVMVQINKILHYTMIWQKIARQIIRDSNYHICLLSRHLD